MALQYTFQSRTRTKLAEALSVVAHEVAGQVVNDAEIERPGMRVILQTLDRGDARSTGEAIGFAPRMSVAFDLVNEGDHAERRTNLARMIRAVMGLLDLDRQDGMLLMDFEQIVLERVGKRLTLNSDWTNWSELPELATIAERYDRRPFPAPFL
ncbi:SitI3 family protein [Polymorphospora sp. NPDC050346]|uniref:SitI3 family protein n=1 Tax=Polymorphospora sp. NPDC050346 TaxID=3155780 RepID=UPI0033EE15BB